MKTPTMTSQPAQPYELFSGVWIATDAMTNEKRALISLQDAGYMLPGESLFIGGLMVERNVGQESSWKLRLGESHLSANSALQLLEELRYFFRYNAIRSI